MSVKKSKLKDNYYQILVCDGKVYSIDKKVELSEDDVTLTLISQGNPDMEDAIQKQSKLIIKGSCQTTLDDVEKPPEFIFVSPIDIKLLWNRIKGIIATDHFDQDILDKVLTDIEIKEKHKKQLTLVIEHAHKVEEVPFDVLAFHRPTQWVEQLFLHALRRYPPLPRQVEDIVKGLSSCVDKTLYIQFYNEFFALRNELSH